MSFIWPWMLLLLLLAPLFVLQYMALQRRRKRIAANYGGLGLTPGTLGRELKARRHIPPAFYLAGLTGLAVAMARPQTTVNLPRLEGTVILAFDVSGSMSADDMKPSRIEAVKDAAREFVQRQPSSVKIGVVAFSGGGFAVQPPTNDQEAILASIGRLKPESGTSIGQGILASLDAIAAEQGQGLSGQEPGTDGDRPPATTPTPVPEGEYISAVILLLSDGENTAPPDPFEAAQVAAERGVRIHTVGIGTPAGTTITVEGFTVNTRMDEETLRGISQLTGGEYYSAGNEQDLQSIYKNLTPQLVVKPEKMEVTALFVGASILILLLGGVFSLLWFSRWP